MKDAKLEGLQKGGKSMKKVFGILMVLVMMASLIAVPASAEGSVTLLEGWFVDANGAKVYDTAKAAEVTPVFYADNAGAAITDASVFLASYDASGLLKSVSLAAAPEIPAGESRIKLENSIATEVDGTAQMVIWQGHTPVMKKISVSAQSSGAEIEEISVGDAKGYIINESKTISYNSSAEVKFSSLYKMGRSAKITVPADTDITAVAPVIKVSEGASISPASGEAVDFTDGYALYTVTAEDGTKAVYTVYVTPATVTKTYKETVGLAFPTFAQEDLPGASKEAVAKSNPMPTGYTFASGTASTETSDNSGTYFLSGSKAGYMTASKGNWGTNAALYYTRADIEAGKALVRDGESLSAYFASTSAEAPLEDGAEELETDIAYVLRSDGKKITHADLGVSKDPADSTNGNLCLKYDKRFSSGVTAATAYNYYQKIPVTPLAKYTKNIINQKFEFDLYVPKGESKNIDTCIDFWSSSESHLSAPFKMLVDTDASTLKLIYKTAEGSSSPTTTVITVPDGCDRWVHITLDVDMGEAGGAFQKVDFYADNVYQSTATFKIGTPSAAYTTYNSTPKTGWYITSAHSQAKGCVYLDNMEINAVISTQ